MQPSEFKALISLLDDQDPEVQQHVHGKLISLGLEGVSRLETAWEAEQSKLIQEAIEEIIHRIQTEDANNRLLGWFRQPAPHLLDGWFALTSYQYPGLDFQHFRAQVNRLVSRTWLELRSGMSVADKIHVINKMLFARERLRPNRKDLQDPQNFFLNTLLETRKGAPISLGLLYLMLCRELEMPLEGLVLPGYFALAYRHGGEEFYVDVFNKGALFPREELVRFLRETNVENEEKYTQPASNQAMMLELIRALMVAYRSKKQLEKAEELQRLIDKVSD